MYWREIAVVELRAWQDWLFWSMQAPSAFRVGAHALHRRVVRFYAGVSASNHRSLLL
jgi:hypothetical protein